MLLSLSKASHLKRNSSHLNIQKNNIVDQDSLIIVNKSSRDQRQQKLFSLPNKKSNGMNTFTTITSASGVATSSTIAIATPFIHLNHSVNDENVQLKKCKMPNSTIGYCQPARGCIMQEPEQQRFTVCEWLTNENEHQKVPKKLCCPKIDVPLQQLKQHYIKWMEKNNKEAFATGLPKHPDGHCGVSLLKPSSTNLLNLLEKEKKHFPYYKLNKKFREPTLWNNNNKNNNNQPRIVFGEDVQIGQIPWMVSIYYKEKFLCGGSIISELHVLTAAHCLSNTRYIKFSFSLSQLAIFLLEYLKTTL